MEISKKRMTNRATDKSLKIELFKRKQIKDRILRQWFASDKLL